MVIVLEEVPYSVFRDASFDDDVDSESRWSFRASSLTGPKLMRHRYYAAMYVIDQTSCELTKIPNMGTATKILSQENTK